MRANSSGCAWFRLVKPEICGSETPNTCAAALGETPRSLQAVADFDTNFSFVRRYQKQDAVLSRARTVGGFDPLSARFRRVVGVDPCS